MTDSTGLKPSLVLVTEFALITLRGGSSMVQLIAEHPDGKKTVINTTQDVDFLDRIVEDRDGTMWIGSDLCDLRVQVVK